MHGEIHKRTHHLSLWEWLKEKQLESMFLGNLYRRTKTMLHAMPGKATFVEWDKGWLNDTDTGQVYGV